VRETVASGLGEQARRARHGALADVLGAQGDADPEELLLHCRGAGRLGEALGHALEAARRAGAGLAFGHAARLYGEARSLLGEEAFRREPERAREAYVEGGKYAFLAGDEATAGALFGAASAGARTAVERASVAGLRAVLENAHVRSEAAIAHALEALRLLGVGHLRQRPGLGQVLWTVARARRRVRRTSDDDLRRLPVSTDPVHVLTVKTLLETASPTYFVDQNLMVLVDVEAFLRTLDRGKTPVTPLACMYVGSMLLHVTGDVRDGERLMRFAMRELAEGRASYAHVARVRFIAATMEMAWSGTLADADAELERAVAVASASGDVTFYAYGMINLLVHAVLSGAHLDGAAALLERYTERMERTHLAGSVEAWAAVARGVRCLRGEAASPTSFDGPGFDEAAFLELARGYPATIMQHYALLKLLVLYVNRDYEAGLRLAEAGAVDAPKAFLGQLQTIEHYFLHALLLGASLDGPCGPLRRARLLLRLHTLARRLARGAALSPRNVAHRHALARAELARGRGDFGAAAAQYERAMAGARACGSARDEAFACERAAGLARARGQVGRGAELEARARAAFVRWGLGGARPNA
jgi:hypothetical protein